MSPRKTAAERAAEAEAAAAEESQSTGDADALQFDPNRLGAPEPYVAKKWPHAARGEIVAQLFDAADKLGYQSDVIRSTSDGFKYPENIDRYLFPSEYKA